MPDDLRPPILVLVRDLMFSSKIIATARAHDFPIKVIRDPAKLADEAGSKLIVDLNLEGAGPAAIAWKGATGGEVVAFAAHVDVEAINAARDGGIDQVLARSQFVAILDTLFVRD